MRGSRGVLGYGRETFRKVGRGSNRRERTGSFICHVLERENVPRKRLHRGNRDQEHSEITQAFQKPTFIPFKMLKKL